MRNTRLPDTLNWTLILREPLLAMVHRDHPLAGRRAVSLKQLAQEPFVFFDPHVGTGLYDDIIGLLRRYNIVPYITQEVGEAMTIIGLVSAGLGVSILPASFQRIRLSDVVWLPIEEPDAQSELWLVWPKHRELSEAAKRISALLTEASWALK